MNQPRAPGQLRQPAPELDTTKRPEAARSWPVIGILARRAVILVYRLPSAFVPATIFPIFLVIAFSGAFGSITNLPGFPTDQPLNWFVPLAVLQGSAFIGVGVGLTTTRDIETGFYDRLLLAPTSRAALMAGPALGGVARSLFPFFVVLGVGTLGGARLVGGPLGAVTLFVASAGTCLFHAFWCLGLAYRFKTQRAAPIMQIGVFLSIFLATAQVPVAVMTGWLAEVAARNPMTAVLALARAGFLGDVTWSDSWPGLAVIAIFVTLAATFAARGFRSMVP